MTNEIPYQPTDRSPYEVYATARDDTYVDAVMALVTLMGEDVFREEVLPRVMDLINDI